MNLIHTAFLLILSIPFILYPQSQDIKFEHISVEQGLSQSYVLCILQDRKGFMWFGTEDGLNKYDGYKFKIYKNDPNDSLSLSNNLITALYEDHLGELWIGTRHGGICRYDRNRDTFIRYEYQKENPNSLCSDLIVSIFESWNKNQHILWIGCGGGLNKYNRETDNFARYYPDKNKAQLEANINWISSITQDYSGQLWIGTRKEGLFKFDAEKDKFIKYKPHPKYSDIFINKFVWKLFPSRQKDQNILWIGSGSNGLYKINLEKGQIKNYVHEPNNPASISDNPVVTILQTQSKSKELWIGTEGGLIRFNTQTEKFINYLHDPLNPKSLNHNSVLSIYEDKSGLLWVGTILGINKFDPQKSKFGTFQQHTANPDGIIENMVTAIYESNSGTDRAELWIGTSTDGLIKLNRLSGQFTRYKHAPENITGKCNWITSISESQYRVKRVLWVSTLCGLYKIDLKTDRITHYYVPGNDLGRNVIYAFCEDKSGVIWMGTHSTYLYSFNTKTEQFNRYWPHSGVILTLHLDSSGILWIGAEEGLVKFNIANKEQIHYQHIPGDLKSISNNDILSIFEDKTGILWIGTSGGLNKFNRSTETFICFNEKDGLSNDAVKGILEDDLGNLWLSTNKGISKFNPISKTFRNYDARDGLQADEFCYGAYHMNRGGEMFFGSINGLNYFHPDNVKDNTYIPPIVITDFQIFNKSIRPEKNSLLKKHISETKEIILPYDQSVFSFEYAALDYHIPEKNKYAYRMDGVDPEWVYTNASRRFATYTHLDPGDYVFNVRASNNDGFWNEEGTSLKIIILPPWWQSNWAYTAYVLLFFLTLYALRSYDRKRQRLNQELEMEHFEADKLREVDHIKSRFFANISHEFRTPLTLILGPVEQMLSGDFKGNFKEQYKVIIRNGKKLLQLINQLLDLSKLESGKLKLQARAIEIISLTNGLVQAFESLAVQKKITLNFKSELDSQEVFIDVDKFEKIINNLLSNAFKFTPEQGTIEVRVCRSEAFPGKFQNNPETFDQNASPQRFPIPNSDFVEIIISNTGLGIPSDKIDKIFDRFYQVDDSYTKDEEGTGIGLALTKELVELHHGTIDVHCTRMEKHPPVSPFDRGDLFSTTFTISLPLGKDHLNEDEVTDESPALASSIQHPASRIEKLSSHISNRASHIAHPASRIPNHKSLILIVEDNTDLRQYIRRNIEGQYRISEAGNGEEGLEKATKEIPDLIISDVMMPKVDGFEFCGKIKTDERTSHIPVILITARAAQEDKLEGLETGADDYLTKPFDTKELRVRVKNLIEQRRRLRKKFSQTDSLNPNDVALTSKDKIFLERAMDLVNKHINDPEFSVEHFANDVGMTRVQLHRKLKALTDHSVGEFTRVVRLHRAAALLKQKKATVSEIAFEVGFNNLSYFARSFRKHFGKSPSAYAADQNLSLNLTSEQK